MGSNDWSVAATGGGRQAGVSPPEGVPAGNGAASNGVTSNGAGSNSVVGNGAGRNGVVGNGVTSNGAGSNGAGVHPPGAPAPAAEGLLARRDDLPAAGDRRAGDPDGPAPAARPRLGWRLTRSARLALPVYLLAQVGYLFWWIGFYPGLGSYDSAAYIWQVTTSNWSTNHSVLYNALVWLSLYSTGGIAALTLIQTITMALALAYAAVGLRGLGAPAWALICAGTLIALLPPVGSFVIYVWKDVPFAIVQLFLLGTLTRIVLRRRLPHTGRWIADRRMRNLLLVLFAEFLLLALFRQNGQLMVLGTAIVVAIVIAGVRGWLLAIGTVAAGLSVVINVWGYPALGVEAAKSDLLLGPAYADIAVAYHDRPEDFTTADTELMAEVASLSHWWYAGEFCFTSDVTTGSGFDREAADEHHGELFSLWIRLVKRMPEEIADARVCRGGIAWDVVGDPRTTLLAPTEGGEDAYGFGSRLEGNRFAGVLSPDPILGPAHDAALWLRKVSDLDSLKWLLWRGATWCYLGYAAVALCAWRRRELAVLGLTSVALANQVVVLVNNPAQLIRYMFGPVFLGLMVLPLFGVARRQAPTSQPGQAQSSEAQQPSVSPEPERPGTPEGEPDAAGRGAPAGAPA